MMDHLSETCLGKENSELVNSMAEVKAPSAKLPRLEQNGSPLGRARLSSNGAKLSGVPYKPGGHLLKTCHKRGEGGRRASLQNIYCSFFFFILCILLLPFATWITFFSREVT